MLLATLLLAVAGPVHAQTFLDHLQKQEAGKGTVTVTQSAAIDSLVNKRKVPVQQTPVVKKPVEKKTTEKPVAKTVTKKNGEAAPHHEVAQQAHHEATHQEPQRRHEPTQAEKDSAKKAERAQKGGNEEVDIPTVDMRKKVMRHSYKVNGYRVQAFAGGNSRADKIKARKAGERLKMAFPDQPIYVHFYSPSWKCRMGNYRSYEEANRYLKKVKALGYKQACILKGKITVQY